MGLDAPSCLILFSINFKGGVFLKVYQNKYQNLHIYIFICICIWMDDNSSSTAGNERRAQTSNKYPDTRGLTDSSLVENHTEDCPPKAPSSIKTQNTAGAVEPFSQPCCHVKSQSPTRAGAAHPSLRVAPNQVSPQWSPQVCDCSMG